MTSTMSLTLISEVMAEEVEEDALARRRQSWRAVGPWLIGKSVSRFR